MRYGSVCSGIEAATVAWHSLGWTPQWFSEIDQFPSRVLAHLYPNVPNLGDMLKLNDNEIYEQSIIDLLVGGTPCQPFSIAGLRAGLDDDRGNLAKEYCRILDRKRPTWFVWENVPGVFSSNNGEDFATILSAFTGNEIKSEAIGNAGIIQAANATKGEAFYSIAWRVLDAQYTGVPQRRRRVFVVGYLGEDWRPPAAVLFESESMRGYFKESDPEETTTSGATTQSTKSGSWWNGSDIADTLTRSNAGGQQRMPDKDNFGAIIVPNPKNTVVNARQDPITSETALPLDTNGNSQAVVTSDKKKVVSPLSTKGDFDRGDEEDKLVIVDLHQITSGENRSNPQPNSPSHTLGSGNAHNAAVFQLGHTEGNGSGMNESGKAYTLESTAAVNQAVFVPDEDHDKRIAGTLTEGFGARGWDAEQIHSGNHSYYNDQIRRLTPLECERLQGFPDNHTNIPGAKDGPRYKAIGNSMAVPVMHWIGRRIDMVDKLITKLNASQ